MRDRDVVVLQVVVGQDLPVLREHLVLAGAVLGPLEDLELVEAERLEERLDRAQQLVERHGGVGAAEDETRPLLDLELRQRDRVAVQAREAARLRRGRELAVELVGPGVVGAAHHPLHRSRAFEDGGGAMAAHVGHGAQHTVVPADHDHRLVADAGGQELTRCGDLGDVPDQRPAATEDLGELLLVQQRVRVGGGGQARDCHLLVQRCRGHRLS